MNRKCLIDGSNLFCFQSGDRMRLVSACIMALEKRSIQWNIIFDANIDHKIESDDDAELLREIQKRWPSGVQICPAGNQADDFILLQADAEGWDVISNDRFRDNAVNYLWIADTDRATRRLHKFMVSTSGNLAIPDLGIFSVIPKLPCDCFAESADIADERSFASNLSAFENIDQPSARLKVDLGSVSSADEALKALNEAHQKQMDAIREQSKMQSKILADATARTVPSEEEDAKAKNPNEDLPWWAKAIGVCTLAVVGGAIWFMSNDD